MNPLNLFFLKDPPLGVKSLERYRFFLFAWLLLIVMGLLAVLSYQTSRQVVEVMRPDLEAKAVLVSESIASQMKRAADLHITIVQLNGLSAYLDDAIDNHPDVAYAAVVVPATGTLFSSQQFGKKAVVSNAMLEHIRSSHPEVGTISEGNIIDVTTLLPDLGQNQVYLHVGVDENYIQTRLSEIKIDFLITLFVVVVITLEALVFVMLLTLDSQTNLIKRFFSSVGVGDFSVAGISDSNDSNSPLIRSLQKRVVLVNQRYHKMVSSIKMMGTDERARPIRQLVDSIEEKFQFSDDKTRQSTATINLQAIRLPLFIYFFCTDMSRPFWPNFVGSFPAPMAGLDANFLMALPMALWGLTMLLATPFGPKLVKSFGLRNSILAGMVPTAGGMLMCAMSDSYPGLLFWRCITAAGFGLVTVAGMLFVTLNAEAGKGARSAAIFIGAQTAAGICGAAIGGILADRLGYSTTMLLSATILGLNCLLVLSIIAPVRMLQDSARKQGGALDFIAVMKSFRFIAFVPLAGFPPRVVLTGFLLYMIPVSLHNFDYSDAAIGRFMMVYFVANIFFSTIVAKLLDKFDCHRLFLVMGTGLMSLAIYQFSTSQTVMVIVSSMTILGLAMAMMATALVSIIPGHFERECTEYGRATVTSLLRMVERIGSILGPILVAFLVKTSGYVDGSAILAYILALLTCGLTLYFSVTSISFKQKSRYD